MSIQDPGDSYSTMIRIWTYLWLNKTFNCMTSHWTMQIVMGIYFKYLVPYSNRGSFISLLLV